MHTYTYIPVANCLRFVVQRVTRFVVQRVTRYSSQEKANKNRKYNLTV